jgi:hypothetical protein
MRLICIDGKNLAHVPLPLAQDTEILLAVNQGVMQTEARASTGTPGAVRS